MQPHVCILRLFSLLISHQPNLSVLRTAVIPTTLYSKTFQHSHQFSHQTYFIKYDIAHHMEITDPPVLFCLKQLPPDHLHVTKQEFECMLNLGIIQTSSSVQFLPLHIFPKMVRRHIFPCEDQHALNQTTAPIITQLLTFLGSLHRCKVPLYF